MANEQSKWQLQVKSVEAAEVSPIIYVIVRGKIQYSNRTYYMQERTVGLYGHTGFAIGKYLTFRRFDTAVVSLEG